MNLCRARRGRARCEMAMGHRGNHVCDFDRGQMLQWQSGVSRAKRHRPRAKIRAQSRDLLKAVREVMACKECAGTYLQEIDGKLVKVQRIALIPARHCNGCLRLVLACCGELAAKVAEDQPTEEFGGDASSAIRRAFGAKA